MSVGTWSWARGCWGTGGVILTGLYLFPAAVALASAVARERRRNTLESLLSRNRSRLGVADS